MSSGLSSAEGRTFTEEVEKARQLYYAEGKKAEAIAAVEALADGGTSSDRVKVEAKLLIGMWCQADDREKARIALKSAIDLCSSKVGQDVFDDLTATLYSELAWLYRGEAKDHEKAIALFQQIASSDRAREGDKIRAAASHRLWAQVALADLYRQKGDYAGAISSWIRVIDGEPGVSFVSHFASPGVLSMVGAMMASLPEGHVDDELLDRFVRSLRRVIAQTVHAPGTCESLQRFIADVRMVQRQFERAAYESRILFEVASTPEELGEAAARLVSCRRGSDGSLGGGSILLLYERFGAPGQDGLVGTDDDLTNPLEAIPAVDADERQQVFGRQIEALPQDWQGRLYRGRLYRFWGKPKEALEELKVAFTICPATKEAIQPIAEEIIQVLFQVSGDPDVGKQFVAFQKFGPTGADGKKGTEDDLVNPLVVHAK